MIELRIGVAPGRVHEVPADLAIVGFFSDERPLRGAAGQADWRLCGALSRLIRAGRLDGTVGEAALLPGGGGIRSGQVLVLGLGERAGFDEAHCAALLRDATRRALGLRARSFALALPGATGRVSDTDARIASLLAISIEALEAAGDAGESIEIAWVVAPEERALAIESLRRRASIPRSEGTVRVRVSAGSAESRHPIAAALSHRAAAAEPVQRIK